MIQDPSKNNACIDCKTRTPNCHSICPSYAKYRRQIKAYNKQVRKMQREAGMGLNWDNPKGLLHRKRGW